MTEVSAKKPRVLLLCGGQSGEHEVSLASARSVLAVAGEQFEVVPRVIDREGRLLPLDASQRVLLEGTSTTEGSLVRGLEPLAGLGSEPVDIVFPLLHGPFGEDGSVQGLLKLLNVPFVGSDVLGSAVGMDKLMMKAVLAAHDVPQVAYRGVTRQRWLEHPDRVLNELSDLDFPLFVKPANLGSSVGISRATHEAELRDALTEAAKYDRRLIVEQGVDARELEVGVLGNDDPQVSPVGEIRFTTGFYDYETKYTDGRAELVIPAEIPDHVAERCRELARRAFLAVDAAGLSRVDCFYVEADDAVYLNEINTMPGFTATSMYPKLWAAAGVGYAELVGRLVMLGLEPR